MTITDPTSAPSTTNALEVRDLELAYVVRGVPRPVLRGVSVTVRPGEAYGLVGESGCGKSTTAYAALRYLPRNGVITGGHILVDGDDQLLFQIRDQCRQWHLQVHQSTLLGMGQSQRVWCTPLQFQPLG